MSDIVHVLVVEDDQTWHVEHPKRCHDDLLGCEVTKAIAGAGHLTAQFGDEDMRAGRYSVELSEEGAVNIEPQPA